MRSTTTGITSPDHKTRPGLGRSTAVAVILALVAAIGVTVAVILGMGDDEKPGSQNESEHNTAQQSPTRQNNDQKNNDEKTSGKHLSTRESIDVDGVHRTYLLSVPHDAGSDALPVVFAFHGHGQSASAMEAYTELNSKPAIVVYPEGEKGRGDERAWQSAPYAATNTDSQDDRMVFKILAHLERTHHIDTHRVYAVGKSNGGGFATQLVCRHPQTFAAVASVAGAYYPATHQGCVSPGSSFLEIHGLKDSVIPYQGGDKNGSHVMGALELTTFMAQRAQCSSQARQEELTPTVTTFTWPGCRGGAEVIHEQVADGDHTWPGAPAGSKSGPGYVNDSFRATDLIWNFFERHHL